MNKKNLPASPGIGRGRWSRVAAFKFVALRNLVIFMSAFALMWSGFTSPARAQAGGASPSQAAALYDSAFPEPNQVMQAYPNEPERVAALLLLRDVALSSSSRNYVWSDLSEEEVSAARQWLGKRGDAWRQQQADAYNQAIKQAQAASNQSDLTQAQRVLIYQGSLDDNGNKQAVAFHNALFKQFAPPLSATRQTRVANDLALTAALTKFGPAALGTLVGTVLLMLIVPWLLAGLSDSSRMARVGSASQGSGGVALPGNLRTVTLKRLIYPVDLESGQVLEEKTWSETHVHVETYGGNHRVVGNTVVTDPIEHRTTSTVVQKDRVWLRNLKGEQSVRTFSGGDFMVRQGQILSFLLLPLRKGGQQTLFAYNHSTNQAKLFGATLGFAHKLKGLRLWVLMMVIAALGGWAVRWMALHVVSSYDEYEQVNAAFFVWLGAAAIVSLIYVVIIKLVYSGRRNRVFRKKYVPAYRQYLEKLTPELARRFG